MISIIDHIGIIDLLITLCCGQKRSLLGKAAHNKESMLTKLLIKNTKGLRSKKITGLMGVKRSERKKHTKELRIHLVTIVGEEPCTNLV